MQEGTPFQVWSNFKAGEFVYHAFGLSPLQPILRARTGLLLWSHVCQLRHQYRSFYYCMGRTTVYLSQLFLELAPRDTCSSGVA